MSSTSEGPGSTPRTDVPSSEAGPASSAPAETSSKRPSGRRRGRADNMLPGRERRRFAVERLLVRLVATAGVIGVGVALGAILASSKVQGWIIGLVVAIVSVMLSALLWSSRQV